MVELNNYFRHRNLKDVNLMLNLNREAMRIAGVKARYIFKNVIDNPLNTVLGESKSIYDYIAKGFDTIILLDDGWYKDTASQVAAMGGYFWDQRSKVSVDYNIWLEDAIESGLVTDSSVTMQEGDLIAIINEDFSYELFDICGVNPPDLRFQFNNSTVYSLVLKQSVIGENKYEGFAPVVEEAITNPDKYDMNLEFNAVMVDMLPNINTPDISEFEIN